MEWRQWDALFDRSAGADAGQSNGESGGELHCDDLKEVAIRELMKKEAERQREMDNREGGELRKKVLTD
jgi:hypothetical protein